MVFFIAAQDLKECVVYYVLLGKLFQNSGSCKIYKKFPQIKNIERETSPNTLVTNSTFE